MKVSVAETSQLGWRSEVSQEDKPGGVAGEATGPEVLATERKWRLGEMFLTETMGLSVRVAQAEEGDNDDHRSLVGKIAGSEGSGSEVIDRDFPGGAVVKNPPANAGDTGSIPGPGRSHMPQSN